MASFNGSTSGRMKTTNKSGHAAYKLSDRTKLVTMALTTMLSERKFYGDNTDELIKLAESMCKAGDGEFVSKLAVWARTNGNLRSVSHALVAVCGHCCSGQVSDDGESFVRKAAREIAMQRGDDGTEIIASFLALYGKPISHAVQRGIRDALTIAKPYSIAKYQSSGKDVKLRDTLRITHPFPVYQDTCEAIGACISGTLPFPKSWETELSARGNTKEVWDELIAEHKVPFMASLRNLRNMVNAGADIDPVLEMLSDREAVAKSRQLPFRFYSAYRELVRSGGVSSKIARALDMALSHACRNVGGLDGRTAVLIDTSGSMSCCISSKSSVSCCDIAAVLGAIVTRASDDACVIGFDSSAHIIPMTGLSVLSDIAMVGHSGGWTNMEAGFDKLMQVGFDADRVVVLSDYEVNGRYGSWRNNAVQTKMDEYRRKVGHDVWCHAIDLQGYGTQQFMGAKTNVMAGWSDSVLRFIGLAERGFGGIVNEIDGMVL